MKTYGNLYDDIISLPNLYRAFIQAKAGKKDKTYLEYSKNLHENMWKLHEDLLFMRYNPSAYTTFYVNDYKRRKITAPDFRDHIVHHAIHNLVEQIYDASFIYDSYACRKGKGTHKAFFRLKKFMNRFSSDAYFIKCDITKYFYSVNHIVLKQILRGKITDEKLIWLFSKIIDSYHEDNLTMQGIPIGNLTSQLFANVYLNELDNYVKKGLLFRNYIRYVDDFVILSNNKQELQSAFYKIKKYLSDDLSLTLKKKKCQLNKLSFGVDFLGYVAFKRYSRVRTRNYRRFKSRISRKIRSVKCRHIDISSVNSSFASYLGHLRHTDSARIKEKILGMQKELDIDAADSAQSNVAATGTMGRMRECST